MTPQRIGIVGASERLGQNLAEALVEQGFPAPCLTAFGEEAGAAVDLAGCNAECQPLETARQAVDILIFATDAQLSRTNAQALKEAGLTVIDGTGAWANENDVPLIAPDVNPEAVPRVPELIACPHAAVGQLAQILKPIGEAAELRRAKVDCAPVVAPSMEQLSGAVRAPFSAEHAVSVEDQMAGGVPRILNSAIRVNASFVPFPGAHVGISQTIHLEGDRPLGPDEVRGSLAHHSGLLLEEGNEDLAAALAAADDAQLRILRIGPDASLSGGLRLRAVGPPPIVWTPRALARLATMLRGGASASSS
jgi:aspartate-semialdehyde dehydrogenase